MATTLPLWADLNGSWMAEMAGRCWIEKDDSRLADAWAIERVIVRRLDKYSAVSRPQLQATVGELAAVGRLNQYTFEHQFGHHIPNAAYRWPAAMAREETDKGPILRGPVVPPESFIILFSGGFNVWCDVDNLVETMNLLMERYPIVHFVATGGRIEGVVSQTFERFKNLVDASPYKDRFHMMGWVDSRDLPRIYRESDLGINVDRPNYETMLGARNRLNAMAAEDLAVATTLGTEISEWLVDGKGAIHAPIGDSEALAAAIEPWIDQREELEVYARNARKMMDEDFSYERTTRALINWLKAPRLAPDNEAKLARTGEAVTDLNAVTLNPLEEEAFLMLLHRPREIKLAMEEAEAYRAAKGKRSVFSVRKPW